MRSALAALLLVACGAGSPRAGRAAPRPPRLVLVAVYDQLGSATLETELPHLDPDGAIRRAIARGTYVHRAELDYASTLTAPGHVAIHGGAVPRESAVGTNRVFSRTARARVSLYDDGAHPIHGRTGAFASPAVVRAETVADVLQRERPESVVVALAMKDRSAVGPGGQRPDLCLFFDARAGGFTTSTWYAGELPPWLVAWRESHPFAAAMSPAWEPHDAAALEARLGPDERSGEGAYGWGASFPHDATGLEDPDAYLSLPAANDHLLAMLDEVIARMSVGADDVTDLIALSIAATDYTGHAFGPGSWEYADVLYRVDRALGAAIARIEASVGPIALVITSDHGVAPLPERARERGIDAHRYATEDELVVLREALGDDARWIDGYVQPYVYLTPDVPERARVIERVIAHLRARPGVGRVYDARAVAETAIAPEDPIDALVWRGIPRTPPGDVYVLPAEGSTSIEDLGRDHGTSHGSAWSYDREVPVIVVGPRVGVREIEARERHCRIAGTIAMLAGVARPEHACEGW